MCWLPLLLSRQPWATYDPLRYLGCLLDPNGSRVNDAQWIESCRTIVRRL